MPYIKPSVDQFIERFPIFADREEDAIQFVLDEAANTIDTSWRVEDYQPAILYLTAHLLATDNSEAGEEVEVGAGIASESFPGMSITYASSGSGSLSSSEAYGKTEFGRRFLMILNRNVGGPLAI